MSAFLTALQVAEVQEAGDRVTWQLLSPLIYQSDVLDRLVTVPGGFITDFASVPRLPVAYLLAGGEANEAATVHDYLYRFAGALRADADAVFDEAMAVSGQPWWRRKLMWAGVRLFGGTYYDQPKGTS